MVYDSNNPVFELHQFHRYQCETSGIRPVRQLVDVVGFPCQFADGVRILPVQPGYDLCRNNCLPDIFTDAHPGFPGSLPDGVILQLGQLRTDYLFLLFRPAKKRIEKQQRVVSTKLTELQYYAIRKRAGEAGLRVSEYVRQAVVSAEVIPRLNRQDADTIRKLAGEANNINQLAHRANAGGFALVAVELVKLKNRIVEIINQLSDDWKNKKGKRV